jgi:hypothetical protein
METMNIMENNKKKEAIEKKLQENELRDFEIKYNHNYYDSNS